MLEVEEAVKEAGAEDGAGRIEEKVPDELRLGYKDELGGKKEQEGAEVTTTAESAELETAATAARSSAVDEGAISIPVRTYQETGPAAATGQQRPATGLQAPLQQGLRGPVQPDDGIPSWIDKAIIGVLFTLAFMIGRLMFR